jgi:hypothetical protein
LHDFANRRAPEWFNTATFTAAGQYAIGKNIPVIGVGELRIPHRGIQCRQHPAFELNDPNGSFGSAAFGTTPARAILAILSLQETPVLTRIPHHHESRLCSERSL